MISRLAWCLSIVILAHCYCGHAGGADATSTVIRQSPDDVQRLADRIDELIAARWQADAISPTKAADDAEFMRRVWLDVAGKIPTAADASDFLESEQPDKRRRLVDKLLSGPNYVVNATNFWRSVLMPEAETNFNVRFMLPSFEAWLRQRIDEETHYDDLVREILTTPLAGANPYRSDTNLTPVAFYLAKETKPENLAAATSRMFLGIRLECAQCHDHPFDEWTQQDFWGYATFFAALERQQPGRNSLLGQLRELFARRTLKIPETTQEVEAKYLGGATPTIPSGTSARIALADWVTSSENVYFSRAAVNRLWGHFFGVGLVDQVDDFSEHNPPSHPELLDLLAEEFSAHEFDVAFLIRAMTASRTYQLSSTAESSAPSTDPQSFSRMAVKGLTAEQLYDSIAQAIGLHETFDNNQRARFNGGARSRFLEQFSDVASGPTARQRSVLQALTLMNGELVTNATSLESSMTLAAIADYPLFDTAQRVDALFLSTLSRKPSSREKERFVNYIELGEPELGRQQALSDVFWILLNSSEFSVNH